jgi:alkaline phosphatase D
MQPLCGTPQRYRFGHLRGHPSSVARAVWNSGCFQASQGEDETGAGSLAVEFVAPGVTNLFPAPGLEEVFLAQNPHVRYAETSNRGYIVLDLTAERIQAAWFHFDPVEEEVADEHFAAAFSTFDGENHLVEEENAAPALDGAPAAAVEVR